MNNARRKLLARLQERIQELKEDFAEILLEEQDAYDNIPESLLETERAEKTENAIENIESILDELDTISETIDETIE